MPRGGPNAGALDRLYETDVDEWLDDPAIPQSKKDAVMTGLDRFNRRVFAYAQFTGWVMAALPPSGKVRVLELGAGHGALSVRIAEKLRSSGRDAELVVSDISESFVSGLRASPELAALGVRVEQVDATQIAHDNGTFDLAVFVQSLHHLPPHMVVKLMREGARVARTLLIIDVWRAPWMMAVAPAVLLLGNYAAMHDGVISLRKMYGREALLAMAQEADVEARVSFGFPGYMKCVIQQK